MTVSKDSSDQFHSVCGLILRQFHTHKFICNQLKKTYSCTTYAKEDEIVGAFGVSVASPVSFQQRQIENTDRSIDRYIDQMITALKKKLFFFPLPPPRWYCRRLNRQWVGWVDGSLIILNNQQIISNYQQSISFYFLFKLFNQFIFKPNKEKENKKKQATITFDINSSCYASTSEMNDWSPLSVNVF